MPKVKTIEDVAAMIDAHIEEIQQRTEIMVRDLGGTDEEVAAALAWELEGMQQSRDKMLEKVKRVMTDFDAPSHELH